MKRFSSEVGTNFLFPVFIVIFLRIGKWSGHQPAEQLRPGLDEQGQGGRQGTEEIQKQVADRVPQTGIQQAGPGKAVHHHALRRDRNGGIRPVGIQQHAVYAAEPGVLLHVPDEKGVHHEFEKLPQDAAEGGEAQGRQHGGGRPKAGALGGFRKGAAQEPRQEAPDHMEHHVPPGEAQVKAQDLPADVGADGKEGGDDVDGRVHPQLQRVLHQGGHVAEGQSEHAEAEAVPAPVAQLPYPKARHGGAEHNMEYVEGAVFPPDPLPPMKQTLALQFRASARRIYYSIIIKIFPQK